MPRKRCGANHGRGRGGRGWKGQRHMEMGGSGTGNESGAPPAQKAKMFVPPDKMIPLVNLNPYITCQLCCGYLINAVTTVECLHTLQECTSGPNEHIEAGNITMKLCFPVCRTCLVKHFFTNLKCPACDIVIHPTNPMANVKYDVQKQDIVSKLLPNLMKEEEQREREFYMSKGLPVPQKEEHGSPDAAETKKLKHRQKERHPLVSLVLEYEGCSGTDRFRPLSKRFVRVTSNATILNVQHFIRKKMNLDMEYEIQVYCDMYELDDELTLEYIRNNILDEEDPIIPLQYQIMKRETREKPFYMSDVDDPYL